jgi:Protein of unknown function (DUF1573)
MRYATKLASAAAALAAVGAALLAIVPGRTPSAWPKVGLDRASHNWGHVRPGSRLSTAFVIRNAGGIRLTFGKPRASCGCTKPELPVRGLAPGASTKLEIGFEAPNDLGAVYHFVTIPTNDPRRPELTLSLFAEVWQSIQASPQAIDFGSLRPGQEVERAIQLFSPDERGFITRHLSADIPQVSVRAEQPNAAARVHRVRIRFRASERLGHYRGWVSVLTDRADATRLAVPVVALVEGSLKVSPDRITIDKSDIGKSVGRVLLVRSNRRGVTPRLQQIEASSPWELDRSEVRDMEGGLVALMISVRFPKGSGAPSGELRLAVEAPDPTDYAVPLIIEGWTPPFPEQGEK